MKPRGSNSVLPLHHGVAPSVASGGAQQMTQALEKTLNLVGLAATKSGSGEKEKAYIIKQNSAMKGLLCLVILACCVLIVVFSTVLEVKVARRGLIMSEAVHHRKEHHDHEALIRTSLELQEALQGTIEETALVEEFRAYFEKAVGSSDDTIDQLFADSGVPNKVVVKAKALQRDFVRSMQIRLAKIINRFQQRAHEARKKVIELAKLMGHEINEDAQEMKRFEAKLEEWGVDEAYTEKLEEAYEEESENENENGDGTEEDDEEEDGEEEADGEGHEAAKKKPAMTAEEKLLTPKQLAEKHRKDKRIDEMLANEREIQNQLDQFFKKLQAVELPAVPVDKIPKLEELLQTTMKGLDDELKEMDMESVAKRFEALIAEVAPGVVVKFDPTMHDSVIDYFAGFIEKAKLYPHKQALLDLYNGSKAPDSKLTALTVLAGIEKAVQHDHLFHLFDLLEGRDIDPKTTTLEERQKVPSIEEESGGGGGDAAGAATANAAAASANA